MLDLDLIATLKKGKNLLAFSGGSDSSALFYLLLEQGIHFDIAHVNYHTRPQSNTEAKAAQTLAAKHQINCYLHEVHLNSTNFEHHARSARYSFFESCIAQHGYTHLLTAHHLGDRLEWFLMQLSKGAGLHELLGMQPQEAREGYILIRPLLHVSKKNLVAYLQHRNISWFEDDTNHDSRYRRNHFRHHYANPLLEAFEAGIARSFEYLDEERSQDALHVSIFGALHLIPTKRRRIDTLRHIDRTLKSMGYLMRGGDRQMLKTHDSHVIGRRFAVVITQQYCFIAPYRQANMSKAFKEQCRVLKIPKQIRGYLYEAPEAFDTLCSFLPSE